MAHLVVYLVGMPGFPGIKKSILEHQFDSRFTPLLAGGTER
jgi:hypothetical protein